MWYEDVVSTLISINDDEVRRLLVKHRHLKDAIADADAITRKNQDALSDTDEFQPEATSKNARNKRAAVASGEHIYSCSSFALTCPELEDEESDGNGATSKPKRAQRGRKRQKKHDRESISRLNSFSNSCHWL